MVSNGNGRPKGAKGHEYAAVEALPPICPKCGLTNDQWKTVRGSKTQSRPHVGRAPKNGQPYDRITTGRYICPCGQHIFLKRYEKAQPAKPTRRRRIRTKAAEKIVQDVEKKCSQ